jgi:hypothetical protein
MSHELATEPKGEVRDAECGDMAGDHDAALRVADPHRWAEGHVDGARPAGGIVFRKDGKDLWRLFEKERGLSWTSTAS